MSKQKNAAPQSGATHGDGQAAQPTPRWKCHLDFYRDQLALTFKSRKDADKAIDLLWTDDLYELPHALAGGDTIIIPADALPYFEGKGLRFRKSKVRSAGDLPPEEINKLRREQGPY
jgi:hypothetical protein